MVKEDNILSRELTLTVDELKLLVDDRKEYYSGEPVQLHLSWVTQAAMWVFDDPRTGLASEPFVLGINEMIDEIILRSGFNVQEAKECGIAVTFHSEPFEGHNSVWDLQIPDSGGNWYVSSESGLRGWLCPALYLYFPEAPTKIYGRVDEIC